MKNLSPTTLIALLAVLTIGSARAQTAVYNNGTTITTTPGTLLTITGGGYQQTAGSTLKTDGTTRVAGSVQSAASSTLNLGVGDLEVLGDVTNFGTTTATPTGTLRLTGTANQTVNVGGGTVGRLVVSKSTASADTVRIPTDLNVSGQVQLIDGMVRTAIGSAVVLPDGATVSGEGSGQYVQGNLRVTRTAVSGASAVDFQNGVVINPQSNALGDVVVNRAAGLSVADVTFGQNPSNPTFQGIDRIWTITPQNQPTPGQPADLTLSWLPENDNGLTPVQLMSAAPWRRATPAAPWERVGSYQDASARTITVATEEFSEWTVAAEVEPLPVELLSFDATRVGDAALLQWVTASERNSAYFEVEVGTDGRHFRSIGRVTAQGNATQRHSYELRDPRLLTYHADPVYYRLRQVDRDGSVASSPVRALRVMGKVAFTAVAWPNPFDAAGLQLQVRSGGEAPVELTLIDAVGRLLQQRTVAVAPGTAQLALPETAALAVGVYILRVRQGTEQVTLRLTRQ